MIRVLVISSSPLFCQGMETLLNEDRDIQIVGRETNLAHAVERVNALGPDVVILGSDGSEWNDCQVILSILDARAGIRVIGLNLEDNCLEIFHEERRIPRGVADLVQAVKENQSSLPQDKASQAETRHPT